MNNYFLSKKYLGSQHVFRENICHLIELYVKRDELEDIFYKDDRIYETDIYTDLCTNFSQDNQNIITFFERLLGRDQDINHISEMDIAFNKVENDNAILGTDFSTISKDMHYITFVSEFISFKRFYAKKRLFTENDAIIENKLNFLYDDYIFDPQVFEDVKEIVQHNRTSEFARLFELLDDIKIHPHTGGLGKTEVLKSQNGVCSKRLDGGDRIIYKLNNGKIFVYSFLGHYENL